MALEAVLAQQLESGIFSLSVDLQPLRSADEVATLLLSLRRYPDGFPNRLEKVADDLGGTYSVEQLTGLLERLVARSAGFMLLTAAVFRQTVPPFTSSRPSAAWLARQRRRLWSGLTSAAERSHRS